MAAPSDKQLKAIFTRSLTANPGLFSFFASVRRLEQLSPGCARVGALTAGSDPVVRFAQTPHLYFPPSELAGFTSAAGKVDTMQVYFFGLFGPNGALPLSLTEYVHERSRHYYDLSIQRFVDMFHDRLMGLFYRAGTSGAAAHSYDRAGDDPLSAAAAALAGVPAAPRVAPLPPTAPVAHARAIAGRGKPQDVCRLLQRYFGLGITLRQSRPSHLSISRECRCLLGRPGVSELGRTAILGERQRSICDRVELETAPISFAQYSRYMPHSPGHRRLRSWLRLVSARPMDWRLHCRLIPSSVPRPALNGSFRLGGNAFLPAENGAPVSCILTI